MEEIYDHKKEGAAWLGTALRNAIREEPISCAEVARRIGMQPSSLSRALAGKRKLTALELFSVMTEIAIESGLQAAVTVDPDGLVRLWLPNGPRRDC